jgi:hypothetical protein
MSEGSSMEIRTLRFRVSWWGIRTTRELLLDRPITFVGDDNTSRPVASDDCTGD